ncbi:hypothetical protein [Novosphingopyxis iocasae]|uniref:hypothetical protein n=1 Tax=Novosphingopyxis iocasae TaxID=2762729 RepID=UPI0016519491|nr:hypothetical protein [Novosphingopyxis iocasae]
MKALVSFFLKEGLEEVAPAPLCESAAKLMILHFGALACWAEDGQDRSFLLQQAARFADDVGAIIGLSRGKPVLDSRKLAEKLIYQPKPYIRTRDLS